MKKFLLGSLALAAVTAAPAMAADMPVAPPPAPVVYYDWSGFYAGFSIGGVWHEVSRHYPNLHLGGFPAATYSSSGEDVIIDFHGGLQWQWGPWVFGFEVGYSIGAWDMKSEVALPFAVFPGGGPGGLQAYNKLTDLVTAGVRLGYAWDRLMIYATGGWANAEIHGQYTCGANGLATFPGVICPGAVAGAGNFSGITRNDGWYVGGGFDWMIHKGPLVDVILGVEYQHFDIGSEKAFCFLSSCAATVFNAFNDFNHEAQGDIIRARLTFKTQGYGILWR